MGLFKNLWDDIKADFGDKPKTTTSTVSCVSGVCTTTSNGGNNGIAVTGTGANQNVHVNLKQGTDSQINVTQNTGLHIIDTGKGNTINIGTGSNSKTAIIVKKVPVSSVPTMILLI